MQELGFPLYKYFVEILDLVDRRILPSTIKLTFTLIQRPNVSCYFMALPRHYHRQTAKEIKKQNKNKIQ